MLGWLPWGFGCGLFFGSGAFLGDLGCFFVALHILPGPRALVFFHRFELPHGPFFHRFAHSAVCPSSSVPPLPARFPVVFLHGRSRPWTASRTSYPARFPVVFLHGRSRPWTAPPALARTPPRDSWFVPVPPRSSSGAHICSVHYTYDALRIMARETICIALQQTCSSAPK